MTLTSRLKRRLGYDTTIEKTVEYPLRHYEVLHLNGEVSTVEACTHKWVEGALKFYEPDNETWAAGVTSTRDMACKPGLSGTRGFDVVRELEGVQENDYEEVGEIRFEFVIDWADHSVQQIERVVIRDTWSESTRKVVYSA